MASSAPQNACIVVALSGDSARFRFAGVALDSASVALSGGSAEEWGWLEGCRQYWGVNGASHGPIMAFMASFAPHMVCIMVALSEGPLLSATPAQRYPRSALPPPSATPPNA
eukprot:gene18779-25319_t